MAYTKIGGSYSVTTATQSTRSSGYSAATQTPLLSTTGLYDLATQLSLKSGGQIASAYRGTSCTCGQCPVHGAAGAGHPGALEGMLGAYDGSGYAARPTYWSKGHNNQKAI